MKNIYKLIWLVVIIAAIIPCSIARGFECVIEKLEDMIGW